MRAIRVHSTGGPEVLQLETLATPSPKPGEALIKVEAAGVNFIDIYYRSGLYKTDLPFVPGMEGAGTVEAVGADAGDVHPGQRVAWAMSLGSYAEYAVVAAWKLVPILEEISTEMAAAAMLQGMTAHYLTRSTYPLKRGDTALVHAAAGGVGLLLTQMAHRLGARVLGTVSTPEKADHARRAGADEVILYSEVDFQTEVARLTGGRGVQVVYDSVGQATFLKSLGSLAPRGMLVLFGQSSGPVAPFDPAVLNAKGSLFLTRPSLGHYASSRDEVAWRSGELFEHIARGHLKIDVDRVLPLEQAAAAHRALEGRQTSGKVLLRNT
ncbi:MAG: quinone oxidoreductase family protein [Acidobacteriota bacterium]